VFPCEWVDNHMVAAWWEDENKPVILDATSLYNRFNEIPAFIQGKECMIAKNDTDFLLYSIPVADPEANLFKDSVSMYLKNNILYGTGKLSLTGEQRVNYKEAFNSTYKIHFNKIIADEKIKASNKFIVDSVTVNPDDDFNSPLVVDYSFSLPDYVSMNGNDIYLNMNIDRFLQEVHINENRTIPVESDFKGSFKLICTFTIPEGYRIEKLPEVKTHKAGPVEFTQEYELSGKVLVLRTSLLVNTLIIENENLEFLKKSLKIINSNYLKTIKLTKI
jgi:hypothetical protein